MYSIHCISFSGSRPGLYELLHTSLQELIPGDLERSVASLDAARSRMLEELSRFGGEDLRSVSPCIAKLACISQVDAVHQLLQRLAVAHYFSCVH